MHRKPGTASSVLNIANGLEKHVSTANGEEILLFTYFTDEMCFHLSGYVNNQNSRVWLATNPHESKDTPLHDQKVGVWCVISRTRIIGLFFFDDAIRWESYYEVVLYPFMGHLNEDEIARGNYQQLVSP
jgi:hypothetical protein